MTIVYYYRGLLYLSLQPLPVTMVALRIRVRLEE